MNHTGHGGWVSGQEWAQCVNDARAADRRTTAAARRVLAGQRRALSIRPP